eukprot:CAMPEP_0206617772 /NCGR_PEP_ID=MMETSP0325_2-20121206/59828_1 /ASSEMBLY_ACC=CAM_ASM_000347 /TAXON_ID=2866 /ORGANISM="Crypthecodinium cohnii, Strain Seligo" /LENGTH=722 /DNA_ID=CAMNT_0054139807 /DNA_START=147 /DNA_END=2312 /DNA_ORIENTATION=+
MNDPGNPDFLLEVWTEAESTKHLNKAILRESSDVKRLLALAVEHQDVLQPLNVATLIHRLAKRLAREGPRFADRTREVQQSAQWRTLLGLVYTHAPNCNNMELTNCLWALATMEAKGRAEEEVAQRLMELSTKYLDTFEPRNLALSAWALAKLGNRSTEWCRLWSAATLRRLADFDTRDLTMVVWAFATLQYRDEGFLRPFCQEVERKIPQGGPQDLGNTLWALAALQFRHDAALAAICKECFEKAAIFDHQNLSISMWSFAILGYKNMNLFHHMTQIITERVQEFPSQGIANTVWSLAKFHFQQKCLLMTVAEDIMPRLDTFQPQHLSIIAWAYATLEFPNRPLLTALCQAATKKMDIFSAQHMANMTWAMATLAHKDEEYLRRLAVQALSQVQNFNPQECSNLAWAFALLAYRDDELLGSLSKRSQEIMMEFIPQNLGNTAWAYNRLGYRDEGLMRRIVQEASMRLSDCQGQETLDIIEAIATGNYIEAVDQACWARLMAWTGQKFELARNFLEKSSELPLTLPGLASFDRALAVQDYRDHLASLEVIGLGYTWTSRLLEHFGVNLPEGRELEAWREAAQQVAGDARHEGDQLKNHEAKEGLRACRTVCVYCCSLQRAATTTPEKPATLVIPPTPLMSGPPTDAYELGLFAATLKHHRGGDGEFQALQACARACAELGCHPLLSEDPAYQAFGEVWLHVTEVPCLSCVGAMAQFRRLFPR